MTVVPRPVADRLMLSCMGHPAAHAALGKLCDTVGGRTSGAGSGDAAEAWALEKLEGWGLPELHHETLEVTVWQRGRLSLQAVAPTSWNLMALAHGYSPEHCDVRAQLIDLGFGEAEDYALAGAEVEGKLVLCDEAVRHGHRQLHRSEKLRLARIHGAAGLLIMSSAEGGLPRTGVCGREIVSIPSLGISQEDGLRLRRMVGHPDLPGPTLHLRMTNSVRPGKARNIMADIPGREQGTGLVLAGAHLDSWDVAQGATDNGLGSAIVLEIARALASLPESLRPRHRLRFALWAAEETGLHGSHHYTTERESELADHLAVMNFDMTGDPYGYWLPGRQDEEGLLAGLSRQMAAVGMRGSIRHRAGLHSDHQPFMLGGVPVVGLLGKLGAQGSRYYHSVGDTFEKVSLPGLCRAAYVGAMTLWALAEAEAVFPQLDSEAVRAMIDEAELYDALIAEGYDGPPMHVQPGAKTEPA